MSNQHQTGAKIVRKATLKRSPSTLPPDGDAPEFVPEPDGWDRFERATAAVVKSAEKHKASQRPARIVKKSKAQSEK